MFTDLTAKNPSGFIGKLMYRNPISHYCMFHKTISTLNLNKNDTFLEIGCGGGVLLKMILSKISYASAIDHSLDMVNLAYNKNLKTVNEGRLII